MLRGESGLDVSKRSGAAGETANLLWGDRPIVDDVSGSFNQRKSRSQSMSRRTRHECVRAQTPAKVRVDMIQAAQRGVGSARVDIGR